MTTPWLPPGALTRPATELSGYRYLSVDSFTRRVTSEFAFSNVSYSFEKNAPGDFSAAIDLYSPQTQFLIPQQTYIVVERSGKPFWIGFLWQPTRDGKKLNIVAQGLWSVFGHRHIREQHSYAGIDRAAILRDLVTYAQLGTGGDLGIVVGTEVLGGFPYSQIWEWWDNKSILDAASELTDVHPTFTHHIDGYWKPGNILGLKFVIDLTYPRLTPHRLIYGGNVDSYTWAPLSPSPNQIDAFGGFDNFAMIRSTVQNSDALTRQPRIEGSVENRDMLVSSAVELLARSALKHQSGSPVQPTLTMQADAAPILGELLPGYQAQVLIDDGPYIHVNGDYIVSKVSVTIPDGAASMPGAETVALEFESIIVDQSIIVMPPPIPPLT